MKRLYPILIFCILAFAGLQAFTACDEVEEQILTEYSLDVVNSAILDATASHDPSDIEKNQYFKYEDNYQVELTEPRIRGLYEAEILDIIESSNSYELSVLNTDTVFDKDGNSEKDISEQKIIINKTNSNLNINLLNKSSGSVFIPTNYSLENNSEIKVYNLKIDSIYMDYPLAVQKKMNCNTQQPCKFRATRIRFLLHELVNKNNPIKYAIDRIFMDEGFFLTGTYSSCLSRFYETNERDYYIKQCSVLRDYGTK